MLITILLSFCFSFIFYALVFFFFLLCVHLKLRNLDISSIDVYRPLSPISNTDWFLFLFFSSKKIINTCLFLTFIFLGIITSLYSISSVAILIKFIDIIKIPLLLQMNSILIFILILYLVLLETINCFLRRLLWSNIWTKVVVIFFYFFLFFFTIFLVSLFFNKNVILLILLKKFVNVIFKAYILYKAGSYSENFFTILDSLFFTTFISDFSEVNLFINVYFIFFIFLLTYLFIFFLTLIIYLIFKNVPIRKKRHNILYFQKYIFFLLCVVFFTKLVLVISINLLCNTLH